MLTSLPGGAVSRAIQLDASGNIYLAGTITPANPQPVQNTSDAFVAKVSADGSKVLYFTVIGGSFSDTTSALALGPDGSAYIGGSTGSSDFPVTPGALQSVYNQAGASQGFLVRVSPAGAVVNATYINGTSFTQVTGIALGKTGEIYLTGSGGPDYQVSSGLPSQGFILKLDAAMRTVLLSAYGYGGGLISLDSQGDMYLAGSAVPTSGNSPQNLPPFPAGAFQTTHGGAFCQTSAGPSGGFARLCSYQFVAKLDPAGKLLWGTYVTGTYGAVAAGMAVDAAGNVTVAGTTNSTDYPVTSGAFQTAYTAAALQPPNTTGNTGPPNSIGYVTKVKSGGTALLWSTYFGGSYQDQITGMAITPAGDIILSGRAGSGDLVFADVPDGCRPSPNQILGFVARLAADGASAAATQPIEGAPDCLYLSCTSLANYQNGWPVALRSDGSVVVGGSNGTVAAVDSSAANRVACVTDPADNAQLSSVAPGQLISIFGADLAPAEAAPNAVGVFFDGRPAPVLYASAQQINVQVPYEISGAASVRLRVVSSRIPNPVSEGRTLAVAARQPSLYLSPAALSSRYQLMSECGGKLLFGQTAIALNEDGTMNDCANPAAAGSMVTVFLNGAGVVAPALATGAIAAAPPVALSPSLDPGPFTGTMVIATTTTPGANSGVAQVQVRAGPPSALFNGPSLAGIPLRERVIQIWTR